VKGYLLDTNIVSELSKGARCAARVQAWYNRSGDRDLFLSVLVMGEIRRGIELRRIKDPAAAQSLERRRNEIEADYADQILPVSLEIAELWGRLSLQQQLPTIDGLLAATALHYRLTFVTRNKKDVERCGVDCFNPFVD
jgi:predicted nucleic acid-binding protein